MRLTEKFYKEKPKKTPLEVFNNPYGSDLHHVPKLVCYTLEQLKDIKQALEELAQYKEIEELCSKVTKQTFFIKCEDGEINEMNYTHYQVLYDFKTKHIEFYNYDFAFMLEVDKYGKTWALTREELEHE